MTVFEPPAPAHPDDDAPEIMQPVAHVYAEGDKVVLTVFLHPAWANAVAQARAKAAERSGR